MSLTIRANEGQLSIFRRARSKLEGQKQLDFVKEYETLPTKSREEVLSLASKYLTLVLV